MEAGNKTWFAVATMLPLVVYTTWSAYKAISLIQRLEIPMTEVKSHPEWKKHLAKIRLRSLVAVIYFVLMLILYRIFV